MNLKTQRQVEASQFKQTEANEKSKLKVETEHKTKKVGDEYYRHTEEYENILTTS